MCLRFEVYFELLGWPMSNLLAQRGRGLSPILLSATMGDLNVLTLVLKSCQDGHLYIQSEHEMCVPEDPEQLR